MSIGARVRVETEVFDPMFCECRRHRVRGRVAPKQRGKWTRNTFVLVVRQLGSETERVPLAGQHDHQAWHANKSPPAAPFTGIHHARVATGPSLSVR